MIKQVLSVSLRILLAAVLVVLIGMKNAGAAPKLNETGSWSCTCVGGTGTCNAQTTGGNLSCYKSTGNSCSGRCKFTVSPDPSGGIPAIGHLPAALPKPGETVKRTLDPLENRGASPLKSGATVPIK
jgi:hypothetical protein